jgi:hypothetical protein
LIAAAVEVSQAYTAATKELYTMELQGIEIRRLIYKGIESLDVTTEDAASADNVARELADAGYKVTAPRGGTYHGKPYWSFVATRPAMDAGDTEPIVAVQQ